MTASFSDDLLQAMGFCELLEAGDMSVPFVSLTVYEARGVALAQAAMEVSTGVVAGVAYRLAIGTSVNEACIALNADVFTENEEEWRKEKKSAGPFVLVQLGPTDEFQCSSGRAKTEQDGSVTTLDCFPGVRAELARLELRALPQIVTALTCVLNEEAQYVALRKIERACVGRTTAGIVVHDIRFEFRGEMFSSYNLASPQLAEKLDVAKNLTLELNPKASRFFALGLAEEDQLKRFLYFFLAIEVETHAVFGRIDHIAAIKSLFDGAPVLGESAAKLLLAQVDGLRNLYDRFVWCASCAWPKLDESDLVQFKALKGARDDIAHGSASEPPPGFARQVERLAHKVLWRKK